MFFGLSDFDKNLESATSHLRLDPDWETILLIADGIRQNDVTPKQAIISIRKKMNSANPHTASYALLVLESIVKNCGAPVHDEICTKESCEWFTLFIESTPHDNVKAKMLELIQVWAFAFRSYDKYQAIRDIVTILKAKGHAFPELKEADAMFTSETAPDWSDGKVCSRCRVPFSFTQRKHHCRHCGKIFCAQCSAKTCTLPKFGIEKEVRVCDGCYTALHTAGGAAAAAMAAALKRDGSGTSSESDLPAEYLASTLAQQSQQPPRKSEQELKEEEELQLALALSQSEAEVANKGRSVGGVASSATYRSLSASMARKSPTPDAPSTLSLGGHQHHHLPAAAANTTVTDAAFEQGVSGDPELAKYLNRDYWEQRKVLESPASPSAPSPMSQTSSVVPLKSVGVEDAEINEFSHSMRTQVEIFVNRMKSNSSRGRNIVTDSAVQTLFMTLTSYHSRLLTYIKDMDDKRMWHEQLQDKLAQVKDSRAALDVLRQEHQDKMRQLAEEQERQRQLLMAHKLDIMRKKKQEYLQYQRQMALQRIQEQEREMAMRQEQQKALYQMGGGMVAGMPSGMTFGQQMAAPMQQQQMAQGSPHHQQQPQMGGVYGQQAYGQTPQMMMGLQQQQQQHGMYGNVMAQQQLPQQHPQQHPQQQQQQQHPQQPQHAQQPGQIPQPQQQQQMMAMGMPAGIPNVMMQMQPPGGQFMAVAPQMAMQPQQQQQAMMPGQLPQQQQQQPQQQQPQQQHQPHAQQHVMLNPAAANAPAPMQAPQQSLNQAPAQPQQPPAAPEAVQQPAPTVAVAAEPAEAELISFD